MGEGFHPSRGVLLYGSSGVGKTIIARQLAEEVEELGAIVVFTSCSSLQSKSSVVGSAEIELTKMFRADCSNKRKGGKLLVLDDIHMICPRRGAPGATTDSIASTLLALIDGIGDRSVTVLATASSPFELDAALRRPGRLDIEIEVPVLDSPHQRAEVIQDLLNFARVPVSEINETCWMDVGTAAKGFNGADCKLAVKEALRYSIAMAGSIKQSLVSTKALKAAVQATKPSTIKAVSVEIPKVKWSDIGGMDDVKKELREATELPLTQDNPFRCLGVPAPCGILLYGPPGCSKTLMARALATEGHMNFLAVKGPELLSQWLGESERALASLFQRARLASPSIIFFDELDAIATKRGVGDTNGRLLSQLLTEIDGIRTKHTKSLTEHVQVIVVGATNRPDLLDSALTRPGRIDRMIYVGVPDKNSRQAIFRVALKNTSYTSDVDVDTLSRDSISQGYSGAELVAVCRNASLLALEEGEGRDGLTQVEMRHLLEALRSTQRQITQEMLTFYKTFRDSSSR